jgi:hypothetical protein
MNILFIGDIIGKPGRDTVKKLLSGLKKEFEIEFVVANAENMHHGKGATEENIEEMQRAGVDFFTSGNHIWKEKSIIPYLENSKSALIRPANYPAGVPGRGWQIVETGMMKRVLVINLLGRLFINVQTDCPFRAADRILKETAHERLDAIVVDFHAETTSEKAAMGFYLDGRVSAMIGTHTHVATADARVLDNGTAYLTDAGFVGPIDSVIGVEKDLIIHNFLTQMPVKHEIAGGPTMFNSVKISIDPKSKKAESIELIQRRLEEP